MPLHNKYIVDYYTPRSDVDRLPHGEPVNITAGALLGKTLMKQSQIRHSPWCFRTLRCNRKIRKHHGECLGWDCFVNGFPLYFLDTIPSPQSSQSMPSTGTGTVGAQRGGEGMGSRGEVYRWTGWIQTRVEAVWRFKKLGLKETQFNSFPFHFIFPLQRKAVDFHIQEYINNCVGVWHLPLTLKLWTHAGSHHSRAYWDLQDESAIAIVVT